jgi:signal transduction histidine kinase
MSFSPSPDPSQESTTHLKGNILAVDDTPANLHLLSDMLSKHGYKVRITPNGKLALQSILANPPDLILLDIMMPDMNGYEVCQTLKANERTRDIPIIFISALNETFDIVKTFKVGGVDYISKPFHLEEVLLRVENQLRIRSQERQLAEQNARLSQEIEERQQVEEALRQSEAREREKAIKLELTLQELKRTQAQLIQTEKMSSLGRMIAGVAQEINNRVSLILSKINPACHYFQYLTALGEIYQKNYPNPPREIQQAIEEIDWEFIVRDWYKIIEKIDGGAKEIQQIVQSLNLLYRLDEAELKTVDIHEIIDNTLLILQQRLRDTDKTDRQLRPEIEVIKDYGELPPVACYASQLNQVLANLLNNAIDALETQSYPGKITISTSVVSAEELAIANNSHLAPSKVEPRGSRSQVEPGNDFEQPRASDSQVEPGNDFEKPAASGSQVEPGNQKTDRIVIRIADNGPGMTEEVLNKMFDPFFTTKPVGSGTGLGLSISHQIVVEKHRGQIRCVSAPGQGTELIVEIPV